MTKLDEHFAAMVVNRIGMKMRVNRINKGESIMDEDERGSDNKCRGIHHLKCWPNQFKKIIRNPSSYDVRLNDREFRAKDSVQFHEWDPEAVMQTGRICDGYTGRSCYGIITRADELGDVVSTLKGYVILTISWEKLEER